MSFTNKRKKYSNQAGRTPCCSLCIGRKFSLNSRHQDNFLAIRICWLANQTLWGMSGFVKYSLIQIWGEGEMEAEGMWLSPGLRCKILCFATVGDVLKTNRPMVDRQLLHKSGNYANQLRKNMACQEPGVSASPPNLSVFTRDTPPGHKVTGQQQVYWLPTPSGDWLLSPRMVPPLKMMNECLKLGVNLWIL